MAFARKLPCFFVAAAYLGMTGCATGPTIDRSRIIEIPLASVHSDIAFTMSNGARNRIAPPERKEKLSKPLSNDAMRFALQVQRIAGILQAGAERLYPDLEQRVPGLIGSSFDVYVVDSDNPGSTSSTDGRIALNAALGAWQPYDDWVAFVIAREMGHVIARHHEENSATSISTSVVLNLLLPGSGWLKSIITAGGSGIAAISKRDVQAMEADAIAVNVLRAAGFSLRDVSLSLLVAPLPMQEDTWSQGFKKSSDYLVAEARNADIAVASIMLQPPQN